MMMLLLIPVVFIRSLIEDREALRQQTINEVSSQWATGQLVYGPILTIPLQKKVIENEKVTVIYDQAHLLPSQLMVEGQVMPRTLQRGIYEVVVYDSRLSFSGTFTGVEQYLASLKDYEAIPEEAFLTIHISDLRGVKENVTLTWNDQPQTVEPGSDIPLLASSGITIKNILREEGSPGGTFSFDLQLQGSQHLEFIPLGKETTVHLSSDWQAPGFSGAFLPKEREVTDQGFTAQWKVLELNRNYPQQWIGARYLPEVQSSSFGVDLLLPIDDYQKSMRSAKYALLAISLTFLTFFLVEIFNQSRLHPFQYILIGLALTLFYILLVSLSEHFPFSLAYLMASVAIIGMIGLYARAILRNIRQTLILVVILCATYLFVFVTLQVRDYALIIGSVGLTAILAFTMYITRNIDWYAVSVSPAETE